MDHELDDPFDASPRGAGEDGDVTQRTSEHWFVLAGAIAALVGWLVVGSLLEADPRGHGTHEKLGLKPCMPMVEWNIPCPGCGVTTSMTHAAHGDVLDSIATQPFGFLLALGLIAFAGWAVVAHARGRDLWRVLQFLNWPRWLSITGAIMGAAWVYKLVLVRGWLG